MMAVIDGIQNKIMPGNPLDKDIYELSKKELATTKVVPGSLGEALDALEKDHKFLLAGDVFTPDVIDTYVSYKREYELDEMALRPHPFEFELYYDN